MYDPKQIAQDICAAAARNPAAAAALQASPMIQCGLTALIATAPQFLAAFAQCMSQRNAPAEEVFKPGTGDRCIEDLPSTSTATNGKRSD